EPADVVGEHGTGLCLAVADERVPDLRELTVVRRILRAARGEGTEAGESERADACSTQESAAIEDGAGQSVHDAGGLSRVLGTVRGQDPVAACTARSA